ncbi:acyl-CoA thioesterase [Nocardioides daphniae]|uniref:Acyl-CoA hydrolase/thioesterase n=1 Tax=Nocardioides daphniae TaxID=402297 RepID=A0A4V1CWI2_9ACTN|nr:thioesterase family protein [Nocardioides daphniae]QCC77357.1 acyl-CoA thioesterase [Nocardioides daphniae]GGD24998.1 putative acyl-CoA hydrolase/thioesterase [Nocardioides daphniae]
MSTPPTVDDYPVQVGQQVRWSDVDMYGHVNNIVYYGWFDTAINTWLQAEAGVEPVSADAIGVVGESACSYENEVGLGDEVTIGLAVREVGRSSITYALAAFVDGRRAALGHWVHVYVARDGSGVTRVPARIAGVAESARADVPVVTLRKL